MAYDMYMLMGRKSRYNRVGDRANQLKKEIVRADSQVRRDELIYTLFLSITTRIKDSGTGSGKWRLSLFYNL
jgi:hypothetical protein